MSFGIVISAVVLSAMITWGVIYERLYRMFQERTDREVADLGRSPRYIKTFEPPPDLETLSRLIALVREIDGKDGKITIEHDGTSAILITSSERWGWRMSATGKHAFEIGVVLAKATEAYEAKMRERIKKGSVLLGKEPAVTYREPAKEES